MGAGLCLYVGAPGSHFSAPGTALARVKGTASQRHSHCHTPTYKHSNAHAQVCTHKHTDMYMCTQTHAYAQTHKHRHMNATPHLCTSALSARLPAQACRELWVLPPPLTTLTPNHLATEPSVRIVDLVTPHPQLNPFPWLSGWCLPPHAAPGPVHCSSPPCPLALQFLFLLSCFLPLRGPLT